MSHHCKMNMNLQEVVVMMGAAMAMAAVPVEVTAETTEAQVEAEERLAART